jgi:hypothetical protein
MHDLETLEFLKTLDFAIRAEEADIYQLQRKRERKQAIYQKFGICGIPDDQIEDWEKIPDNYK